MIDLNTIKGLNEFSILYNRAITINNSKHAGWKPRGSLRCL